MTQKNEMTALYSELAPQFLAFLDIEAKKLNAQIDRLRNVGESEASLVEVDEVEPIAIESDPPAESEPVLLNEEVVESDLTVSDE